MEFKNKIFRAEAIKNIRFYEEYSYQEDLMFMINVYANINSMYYLPEAFYEYYPLPTGLYSSYRVDLGLKFIKARKVMLQLINQYAINNIDKFNFDNAFLYNICYYIYRTYNRKDLGKDRKRLISEVLNNSIVLECCKSLLSSVTSFDKRIAKAIYNNHYLLTLALIKFVYSGKAGKVQKIISKIRN
jgi:hypothetical protein